MSSRAAPYGGAAAVPDTRWSTRDIVVTAVIAVAFGVVFWAWGYVWNFAGPLFTALKPAEYVISGIWLMPAIIAPLIVRKPGAAIYAEMVAAILENVLGSTWGLDVLFSGFVQGVAAEIVFAFALYRVFSLRVVLVAAGLAGVGEAIHDILIYYPTYSLDLQIATIVAAAISGVVVAGLGSWWLVRALRRAGVLEGFPAND